MPERHDVNSRGAVYWRWSLITEPRAVATGSYVQLALIVVYGMLNVGSGRYRSRFCIESLKRWTTVGRPLHVLTRFNS